MEKQAAAMRARAGRLDGGVELPPGAQMSALSRHPSIYLPGLYPRRPSIYHPGLHLLLCALGAIVRLLLHDVDRAKMDNSTVVCVVLEKEKKSYRVGNVGGVYKELISRAHLQYVPTATPEMMGLDELLRTWQGAPHVSIRAIARAPSHAGGQGFQRCSCKGDCLTPRCKCFRLGLVCNSRYHPKNSGCCNHD